MEASQVERCLEIMLALWPVPTWSKATIAIYRDRLGSLPAVQTEDAIRSLADSSDRRPAVAAIVQATKGSGGDRVDQADTQFRAKFTQWQAGERELKQYGLPRSERLEIARGIRKAAGRERKPHADNEAWQALLEDMADHYETSTDTVLFTNCPKISDYLGKGQSHGVDEAYKRGPARTVEEAKERSGF